MYSYSIFLCFEIRIRGLCSILLGATKVAIKKGSLIKKPENIGTYCIPNRVGTFLIYVSPFLIVQGHPSKAPRQTRTSHRIIHRSFLLGTVSTFVRKHNRERRAGELIRQWSLLGYDHLQLGRRNCVFLFRKLLVQFRLLNHFHKQCLGHGGPVST